MTSTLTEHAPCERFALARRIAFYTNRHVSTESRGYVCVCVYRRCLLKVTLIGFGFD